MAIVVIQTAIQPTTGLRDLTDVQSFEHLTLDDLAELNNQRKQAKEQADKRNDDKKAMLAFALAIKSYRSLGYIYFKSWASLYCYLDELFSKNAKLGVERFNIDYVNTAGKITTADCVIEIDCTKQKDTLEVQISTAVNGVGTLATLRVNSKQNKDCIYSALEDFAILARTHRKVD